MKWNIFKIKLPSIKSGNVSSLWSQPNFTARAKTERHTKVLYNHTHIHGSYKPLTLSISIETHLHTHEPTLIHTVCYMITNWWDPLISCHFVSPLVIQAICNICVPCVCVYCMSTHLKAWYRCPPHLWSQHSRRFLQGKKSQGTLSLGEWHRKDKIDKLTS